MNRRSLFGRFAAPLVSNRTAERPDYFKVNLEPLEKRFLLATIYVNDTWTKAGGGTLNFNDTVTSSASLDGVHLGTISGNYGVTAFGTVTNATSSVTGQHWLDGNNDGAASHLITDAIEHGTNNGDTLSILEGTYTESDIVIDKQILFSGTGVSGTGLTKIVPETTSAQTGSALAEFGVGTHSGVIIFSDHVTVQNVMVDGNGNTSLSGTMNYHQGITTLYDFQNGGDYSALHGGIDENSGTIHPHQLGTSDGGGRPNRSEPVDLVQNVRVDNVFWHGITFSALTGQQFGLSGTAAQNQVINSVVNNVGPTGQQDANRIGIMTANLDNYPNSSPDLGSVPAGTILSDTITNAGVGAATGTYGAIDTNNGARIKGAITFTTVTNAVTIGIDYATNDGNANDKQNVINFAPGNTAIGMLIDNSDTTRYSFITITNAHIGIKITHSSFSSGANGAPLLGGTTTLVGPGTTEAGSIGVWLTNSSQNPRTDAALALALDISGYQTGVKADQPFSTVHSGSISAIANNGGNIVRVTTPSAHGLTTGDTVAIAGITGTGISGAVTGVVYNGDGDLSHARITTASTAGMINGERINLAGIGGTIEANGAYNIFNLTGTTFDVDLDANVTNAYTSGGTWTVVPNANGEFGVTVVDATHFDLNGVLYTFATSNVSAGTYRSPTQSHLVLDRANVHGNAVGYNISGTYMVEGAMSTTDPVIDPGATFEAGFSSLLNSFYNSITNETNPNPLPTTIRLKPPDPLGVVAPAPNPDVMSTGNFSLDASSTLKVDINGNPAAVKTINDFNGAPLFYTLVTETNPWRVGFSSPGALGTWFGNTSQSGGSLNISTVASELGAVFDLQNPNNPIDMRGMTHMQVVAKKASGTTAKEFFIVFGDSDGTSYAYAFPYSTLSSTVFQTLSINLLAVGSSVQGCLSGLNMSDVTAWAVAADLGDDDMNASDSFGISIDNIGLYAPNANSLVNVTGTVSLNGATLGANVYNNFTPSTSQQFTLINNDGSDPVSGTFAGLAEGATVTTPSGKAFTISYVGGTGNDVVLTQTAAGTVAGTKLFYNASTKWDVTNGATFSDDNAIAPDKTAYLPGGGTATFSAVSSYDKGINGIMVDVTGAHGAISASDFVFKVGRNNSPGGWVTTTAPTTVTTRAGAGTGGSDRVELLWATADAVKKNWLEVIVKGNDATGGSDTNTGLPASYVFYFGNALADAGVGESGGFTVTSTDEISARNDPHGALNPATISNVNDYNRDGQVTSTDQILSRNNGTGAFNQLNFLVVGAGGPFAPATSGGSGGDSGVASGLAASSSSTSALPAGSTAPGWLGQRLEALAAASSASSSSNAVGAALASSDDAKSDEGDDSLGDLLSGL